VSCVVVFYPVCNGALAGSPEAEVRRTKYNPPATHHSIPLLALPLFVLLSSLLCPQLPAHLLQVAAGLKA
jgi:hypothetical protein